MRTALLVLTVLPLFTLSVSARPSNPDPALEIVVALKEIGVQPEDVVVRDVAFWKRFGPKLKLDGRMLEGVALPAESDPLRPDIVDRTLRRPLDAVGIAMAPTTLLPLARPGRAGGPAQADPPVLGPDPIPADEKVPARVRDLARALAAVEDAVTALLPGSEPDVRMTVWLTDGVPDAEVGAARRAFDRLANLDWLPLVRQVHRLKSLAVQIGRKPKGFPVREPRRIETARGLVILGTQKSDSYEEDAWLVVDPGGDDVWRNNAGGTAGGFRVALAVDLGGNDLYESDRPFVQGAAYEGVGVLLDFEGRDRFKGTRFVQGAAVGGVGYLYNWHGEDSYDAKEFAQGAAALGYGDLTDQGHERLPSDDVYAIDRLGQGLGRTGGHGVLLDREGNDRYTARPAHESPYSQWTGGRTIHWSFAQGCGLGFYARYEEELPDGSKGLVIRDLVPGGVGLIYDRGGDDVYEGSMYAQGTGYFYGLGVCYDASGNDTYTCTWYGQGAAPHFACGILVDGSGDDSYTGMHQVQGNARDFATAVFIDHAGNDTYVAEDRVQGCGDHRDAWGFFVDVAGDDRYVVKRKSGQGWTTLVKPEEQPTADMPYADHGVFLDLAGTDVYEEKARGADGTTWIQKATGRAIGIDR